MVTSLVVCCGSRAQRRRAASQYCGNSSMQVRYHSGARWPRRRHTSGRRAHCDIRLRSRAWRAVMVEIPSEGLGLFAGPMPLWLGLRQDQPFGLEPMEPGAVRLIPARGKEGRDSGASWLALAALLILPRLGAITRGATSNLEDMSRGINDPLVFSFAALKIIGDSRVEERVSWLEVILVCVTRCCHGGGLPCVRTNRRNCVDGSEPVSICGQHDGSQDGHEHEVHGLACISHQVTAGDTNMTTFAALNAARVLDVLSSTPARPDSRSPCKCSHLRALARNLVRKAG